jgi:hypothetical protein
LRQTGAPLAACFDELLTQAPLARLRAALPVDSPVRQPRIALRDLAAGMIGILAAGAAAWVALSLGLLRERQDWRTAVVEYTNLYTNETFSPLNPDASLQAIELSALGARVGVNLTPESVALPGLRFTVAFMLSYNGAPLGVVAYVDPSGEPVLLCIIANDAPDAPMRSERRDNLQKDFVKMPSRVGLRAALAQLCCNYRSEMIHPAAHGFVGDRDPALGQQILDVAKAEGEPEGSVANLAGGGIPGIWTPVG